MINDMGKLLNVRAPDVRGTGAVINLESKPLTAGMSPITNKLVKITDFKYTLRFAPETEDGTGESDGYDFLVVADVLPNGKLRYKNTSSLKSIIEEESNQYNKPLCWLAKWTNILDEELHDVCYWNPRTSFMLSFDTAKYSNYIKAQLPDDQKKYPVFMTYEKAQKRIRDYQKYSKTDEYIQKKQNRGVMIYDFT